MLNGKISPISSGGIPGYNRVINQLVEAVNWLSGIRSANGKPITDSSTGPVIDLSPVGGPPAAASSGEPGTVSLTDASAEGTSLISDPSGVLKRLDTGDDLSINDSGGVITFILAEPWKTTPDGEPAGWVQHQVCIDGVVQYKYFWGQTT